MIRVLPASAEDLTLIRALLEGCGLPTSDLQSARPEFAVVRENDEVVAAGALQRFGSTALLRSVAVAAEWRGGGFGQAIVRELERLALTVGITRIVLLTQTAVKFFAEQGYRVVERNTAPEDVRGSEEFRSLCPGSATCMAKSLAGPA